MFQLHFQQAAGSHAPVHGECDQFAVATCAGYVVFHVFGGHVQAVAHGLVRPHAATQVNVRKHIAMVVRFQLHCPQCLFCWPLDDMIDQTTRRAGARLDATGALEQFDALAVIQAQGCFCAVGQAVPAEVVA